MIIESMFNLYDEEITLETSETDPEGETVVTFEDGHKKVFETYEKACKYCNRRGYID